jgi:hypothetical protein
MDVLIFKSFYLESCIWPDVTSQWIWQRNSECASYLVQISKVRWRPCNDYASVQGRKHEPYTCIWMACWNSLNPKKARQVMSKVKSILFIFFDIKGIVHAESILMVFTFTPKKKKLHGLGPRANYTDRATTACRWSDCQLLWIEGATWSAWRIPTAVFSVF